MSATEPPSIDGAEHHWRDIGAFKVHYAEAGNPDAPPVLLLHGWPQHHGMWAPVIERLRDSFRLIAPDLRGFGWSEAPGHGYDVETFTADQIALLDALEIESAHVIGHDWGGWTAFMLGIDHPSRVERLLPCNTPHPWLAQRLSLIPELWRSWYTVMNAAPAIGRRMVPRMARTILSRGNAGDPFTRQEIAAYADLFLDRARAEAGSKLYRHYLRSIGDGIRGTYDSQRLTPSTLLLFGARDRWVTKKAVERPEAYERHADDLTVELVPDSGHFVIDEKPGLVADRALEHLSRESRLAAADR